MIYCRFNTADYPNVAWSRYLDVSTHFCSCLLHSLRTDGKHEVYFHLRKKTTFTNFKL